MSEYLVGLGVLAVYVGLPICYLHGIYLGFQEGFLSFFLALAIVPWGMLKGLIGFF